MEKEAKCLSKAIQQLSVWSIPFQYYLYAVRGSRQNNFFEHDRNIKLKYSSSILQYLIRVAINFTILMSGTEDF